MLNKRITIKVYDLIIICILLQLILHVVNLLGGLPSICREMYRLI
jgi:hypothetical protein